MHIVTKILVVFAAVLAVLLSALTVAYAVNVNVVTNEYHAMSASNEATKSNAQQDNAAAAIEQARLKEDLQAAQQQVSAAQASVRDKEAQLFTLRGERDAARQELAAIKNNIAKFGETVSTMTALIETYRGEVTTLRDNELQYRRREIELVDRISDLDSQREVLEQTTRALQEELRSVQDRLASLPPDVIGLADLGARQPFEPAIALKGRVVRTQQDPSTGSLMGEIDLGANNQVRENMKLMIVRNGQFIGYFIVTRTDLRSSIGRVDTLGKETTIQPGDEILSIGR